MRNRQKILSEVLVIWCISVPCVYSQYYETREYRRPEGRYLSVGILREEFAPRQNNSLADSAASRFTAFMPMVAFRQGQTEVYLGYTRFDERGGSRTAVVFGMQMGHEIPLGGAQSQGLVLPLVIAADYMKVESSALQRDDFNIASIGLGAGLKYHSVAPGAEFWIQGAEVFHFAFQGLAAGTGSSLATMGEAVLFLPRVGIGEGIVLAYRVRLQTWALNDARYDYRSLYHGPSLGILF
jgi:hypothetical protein